jgi:hypothetical protein
MTDIEYRVADLINFSSNQKPLEFSSAFEYVLKDKLASAIETKKTEIAQTLFNPQSDVQDHDDEENNEEDTEEVEDNEDAEVA